MTKKVKWNKKVFIRNLAVFAFFVFLFYEFVCYLNDVLTFCVNYCK